LVRKTVQEKEERCKKNRQVVIKLDGSGKEKGPATGQRYRDLRITGKTGGSDGSR